MFRGQKNSCFISGFITDTIKFVKRKKTKKPAYKPVNAYFADVLNGMNLI